MKTEGKTYGEMLGAAMEITTQAEADEYFEALVQRCMESGKTRTESETIQRSNLGYWAGYYNNETRERVERLFRCSHPVFGAIAQDGPPSARKAFEMGVALGEKARKL